jgi:hypothetical protein
MRTDLLSEKELFETPLGIFSKYGTKAAPTDFAIALGASVSGIDFTSEGTELKHRTGYYWLRFDNLRDSGVVALSNGYKSTMNFQFRTGGIRPVLELSSVPAPYRKAEINASGIKEIRFGEYPQSAVSPALHETLEEKFGSGKLAPTGYTYSTDTVRHDDFLTKVSLSKIEEYEFEGRRFVRIKANSCRSGLPFTLSNGCEYIDGDTVWIETESVVWLEDEMTGKLVSKQILVSGIPFRHRDRHVRSQKYNYEISDLRLFLDRCFSAEAFASVKETAGESLSVGIGTEKAPLPRLNPYGFNFEKVTEEDIIRGAIQSDVAVFLHGRSSEGKSARVKQLDPDCVIIYLRNATPDSLNGKSVYNAQTGEMTDIPPVWYVKLKDKCESEPDKLHIVFFDELTNALPSIQGMAFNIILEKEVNGKWLLPENARIAAAGNDLNDSLAANRMAEPLFNRFAHVYINTTAKSWLRWASTPESSYKRLDNVRLEKHPKIHPAVFAYIACKSGRGDEVLRTPFTGELPNADPRKWEMASKLLYSAKQPEMLRSLIGGELTEDFVAFARQRVLTVDDVLGGNYTQEDMEMDTSQKFATAVSLSCVDDTDFDKVREFMKLIGPEPRAAFESMWAAGDEKRLEKIAEIRLIESGSGENA